MRRALEYAKSFGGVIAQHAQDPRLTENAQMNEGALSSELGLTGWPSVAEEAIIARDVLLAQHVGARLHICHVSTAGSVDVVRWAKARGIAVTAEVTPHHLMLTEQLVAHADDPYAPSYDARFKVNPPLRREEDVLAVREGLADGTIDIIATDHAPHPAESKDCEWDAAAFGMVGLESALSVVQASVVDSGMLDWADIARVFSRVPAEIGRMAGYASGIAVGAPANLVLYDASVRREFTTDALRGLSVNSPFLGRTLPGRVIATLHNGYPTVLDGELLDAATVSESARTHAGTGARRG
jgi:dihydroorotase